MKNFFPLLTLITLFSAIGCKNIDKELVGKMQSDAAALGNLAAPMEDLGKKLQNLSGLVNAAPESVKNSGSNEYAELFNLSGAMYQKQQASMVEYNDLLNKLKTLAADYSAGKIKTEEAQKEFEILKTSADGLSQSVKRMNEVADQTEAQYAKMSAGWKAEEEAK